MNQLDLKLNAATRFVDAARRVQARLAMDYGL